MALSPGLIDLMVGGGFGESLLLGDHLEIARKSLRRGVTCLQMTIGALSLQTIRKIVANARIAMVYYGGGVDAAEVLGLYFTGPFQNPGVTAGWSC